MPWIVFFAFGAGLALVAKAGDTRSGLGVKFTKDKGILANLAVDRKALASAIAATPRASDIVENKLLGPYRVIDVRRMAKQVVSMLPDFELEIVRDAYDELDWEVLEDGINRIRSRYNILRSSKFEDPQIEREAWIWYVIAPAFEVLGFAEFILRHDDYLGEGRYCYTKAGQKVKVTSRDQALKMSNRAKDGTKIPCWNYRSAELIQGIAVWLCGYFVSPGNSLYSDSDRTPKFAFNEPGKPPSGSGWKKVGTSAAGNGFVLWLHGNLRRSSDVESLEYLVKVSSNVETKYKFVKDYDKPDNYKAAFERTTILRAWDGQSAETRLANADLIFQSSTQYLVRTEFLAARALAETIKELEDAWPWWKWALVAVAVIAAAALVYFGMPLIAPLISSLGSALSAAWGSAVAVSTAYVGTTVTTFLVVTLKSVIGKLVYDLIKTYGIDEILGYIDSIGEVAEAFPQYVAGSKAALDSALQNSEQLKTEYARKGGEAAGSYLAGAIS